MKRRAAASPRISEAEWLVMRVFWDRSPTTAKDVVRELQARTRWKPKTILTLINRLVKKGVLGFIKEGRAYLYSPKIAEQECVRSESRSFLERVYGGAVRPMLAHFVHEARLTEKEIVDLRRILDEKEAQAKAGKSRSRKAGA